MNTCQFKNPITSRCQASLAVIIRSYTLEVGFFVAVKPLDTNIAIIDNFALNVQTSISELLQVSKMCCEGKDKLCKSVKSNKHKQPIPNLAWIM